MKTNRISPKELTLNQTIAKKGKRKERTLYLKYGSLEYNKIFTQENKIKINAQMYSSPPGILVL